MEGFTPAEAKQYLMETQGFTSSEADEYLTEKGMSTSRTGGDQGLLSQLDKPRAYTVTAAINALKNLTGKDLGIPNASMEDVGRGAGNTSRELLSALGIDTNSTVKDADQKAMSQVSPAFRKIMEDQGFGQSGLFNDMRGSAPLELATDIATDPTTYLAGPIAQGLSKVGKAAGAEKVLAAVAKPIKSVGSAIYEYPFKKIDTIRELEGYQKLSELLKENKVSGSWKDLKSALEKMRDETWNKISPIYDDMTAAGYRQDPEALARDMSLPYYPDASDFDKAQSVASQEFANKIVGSKKPVGYTKEVNDWKAKMKTYLKDKKRFQSQTGSVENQFVMPLNDDLQRTSEKFIPYEKYGKDAENLVAEPLEFMTQGELRPLPTKTIDEARSVQGDFMLKRRQDKEATEALEKALGKGYQSEIFNTQLTPREYGVGSVPGTSSGTGQLEMIMNPGVKPMRPSKGLSAGEVFQSKKDVGNAVRNWEALDRTKAGELQARAYDVIKNNLERGAEKYLGSGAGKNLAEQNSRYGSLLDALEYTDPNIIKDAGKKLSSTSVGISTLSPNTALAAAAKEGFELSRGVKPLTKAGLGIENMADWIKALDSKDASKLGYILRETNRPNGE